MSQHDLILLAIALSVVIGIVIAIAKFKIHPFPALMMGALALGLATGTGPEQILKTFRTGFGETLANVGVLLALGAMFGELLASSGGAERVSSVKTGVHAQPIFPGEAGLIGNGLLSQFQVTVDIPGSRLLLPRVAR